MEKKRSLHRRTKLIKRPWLTRGWKCQKHPPPRKSFLPFSTPNIVLNILPKGIPWNICHRIFCAYIPSFLCKQEKRLKIEINDPKKSRKKRLFVEKSRANIMPHEELGMEISSLRKELQISVEKSNFLEKENQELRQELGRLKSQIQSLKSHTNDTKSVLWKKFYNSMDAAESPPASPPAPATDKRVKQPVWAAVKENQRMQAVALAPAPAPPPPPLPTKLLVGSKAVRRVPEVLELYRSLTKRDAQKESAAAHGGFPAVAFTRNMIGEIENRSAYLSAIKSEVETHGEFVNWLIKEVEGAAPRDIAEVERFVKWLDGQLGSLVDERAVLKHFPRWPEGKADALREAAFSYRDLKNLETEACTFTDNPKEEMGVVLKRAQALQDRRECWSRV